MFCKDQSFALLHSTQSAHNSPKRERRDKPHSDAVRSVLNICFFEFFACLEFRI